MKGEPPAWRVRRRDTAVDESVQHLLISWMFQRFENDAVAPHLELATTEVPGSQRVWIRNVVRVWLFQGDPDRHMHIRAPYDRQNHLRFSEWNHHGWATDAANDDNNCCHAGGRSAGR